MSETNLFFGVLCHAIGATSAAVCYTPQKKTRHWSWQTYWLAQAFICWLVLPWLGAWLTIPHLAAVLAEAPRVAMLNAFTLGVLYGIGGTAFGIAIRTIGFSVTYAISIGISCVLGTLLPLVLAGQVLSFWIKPGAHWVFLGIAVATIGILTSGIAGRLKDSDHSANTTSQLTRGLAFAVAAGILSAVFGLSLAAGQPIADVAALHGAGQFQGNVIYIFSCGGAFLTTALYCLYLHARHKTIAEYTALPAGEGKRLPANFLLAALTGLLWYGQFFFYGIGHTHMGAYKFTSWALHMAMLVMVSALVGLLLKEWRGCKPRTFAVLGVALAILLLAVAAITYGNYLAA